ncbi:Photosystem I chlorophyll a apoprotein A2 [compost metagenome]
MKTKRFRLLIAGFTGVLLAACTDFHEVQGDRSYDALAYQEAIHHYEKIDEKTHKTSTEIRLADSYFKTGNLDSAETKYAHASGHSDVPANGYFNYAKTLMYNGKHQLAAEWFEKYLKVNPDDNVAQMLLSSCRSIKDRYIDTTLYTLTPILEEQFTNTFSMVEYQNGAVFTADKAVFSGKKATAWTGNSYLDLYQMEKDSSGAWLEPRLLQGDINSKFHEGPATFSQDGKTVYFTRSNYFKRKMEVNEENENNLKIFKAVLTGGKWKNLEEFPYNSDDYDCGHPTLSADGQELYFVSDMPGGYGGTDLYKSVWTVDGWSQPQNLGSELNTSGNEMFPFINTDGALYFSSDAHNSMGGLDVFITYFDGEKWANPENLNYPLNSTDDDFAYSVNMDNHSGFVSSSRSDSDKMYAFEHHAPTFILYGTALEKGTNLPVEGVAVELTDSKTNQVMTAVTDKEGKFKIKLSPEVYYKLYCTKFGCSSETNEVSTMGLKYSQDFYANFLVEPIVIDKPIVVENIYYDYNKWNIRADAALELDKLVRILKDNPTIEIELGSHTDSRGNDQYNFVLSDKRAYAVVQYLIANGIDSSRLTYKGYGEKVLVNQCGNGVICSEEAHQQNRRTEFKVTKVRQNL